jgi:glycosyltransferase involved in cell wall biosynthesis
MKILIVNNLYPPHSRGGAETAVVAESRALADAGHDVTVLTTRPWSGFGSLSPSVTDESGVNVLRFYPLNLFWYRNDSKHNAFTRALWHLGNLLIPHPGGVLRRVIRDLKPEVVHLHNVNGLSYWYPRICDRMKVRTLFTVHAVHYAVPSGVIIRNEPPSKLFTPFAAILRWVLKSSATITAPSQWLLDFYAARGFFKGQKTIVIPNPSLMGRLVPDPLTSHLAEKASGGWREGEAPAAPPAGESRGRTAGSRSDRTRHEPFRFLFVGQLEPYKGINVLIAAAHRLPEAPRFEIDIVGDGSMATELRKLRDQRVRMRGKLSGEELARAYANADALVVPSLCEENAPMVIAEAFGAGLPVIASRIGGISEMVADGENGVLVAPGDVEDLALAMRRMLEHPEIIPPFAHHARERAARYTPASFTAALLHLLAKPRT